MSDKLIAYDTVAYIRIGFIYILYIWSFVFVNSRIFPLMIGRLAILALLTALFT